MNLTTLRRIWRDCQAEKKSYPRLRDWLARLYDRALNRWPAAPLPFRKMPWGVHLPELSEPLFVRLGSSDWLVLNELFVLREYEPLLQYDVAPRLIVDLGSNIGMSLRLWRQVFPEARIIAVEPDAGNAGVLCRNVPETGRGKVTLEQVCVVGYARPVRLRQDGGEWGYSVENAGGAGDNEGGTIPALTMSELLQRHAPDETVDLLKCDIEGTEAELFRDCGAWLGRVRYCMIELHGSYRPKDLERDASASGVPIEVLWSNEGADLSMVLFTTRPGENRVETEVAVGSASEGH